MARVFVSHASEDRTLAGELHRWLVDEGHEVFLDQDLHGGIAVGEQWQQRIYERLRWADTVVCVVTSAYLASTWCATEIGIAQSRGSRLLPLRAESGVVHPMLASLQHADYALDPDVARAELTAALRRFDAAWPDGRSPFPGLRPFEADQHRVFFGRTGEIGQLAELLRSPARRAEGAVLLVVGPSGCGKSSLVRAGLVPVMAGEPGWSALAPIVPGADPVAALVRELVAAAAQFGLDWTVPQLRHRLDEDGLAGPVDELLRAAPGQPQRHLLVVVDQFEELLTQTVPGERARFAGLLRPVLAGPVQLVGTLRPEFFDQLLSDPELAVLPAQVYPLRPLRPETLRAVIEGPAQLAGINVDGTLVDRLIEDTGGGDGLPLLAFTLAQLTENISRGGQLSAARYEQLGGVQGALVRQADRALVAAVTAGGRSREEVISGLLRLVTVDEQGRPTRWRVRRDELPAAVVAELDAFVAGRLLTTDTDDGTAVIGVVHEAFLSAWPPLAEAITASASALRARRAVEHAATEWSEHARSPTRLWSGGQLAAAVTDTGARIRAGDVSSPGRRSRARWRPRMLVTDRVDLSAPARDFLHASIRQDRSRRRRVTTVLSVLLILALVGAGVSVVLRGIAEQRQRIATAGQLVVEAEAARGTDLRAALLLGLAAHHLRPDSETRSSLVNTLAAGPYVGTLTGHTGSVKSMAFAPDGRTLVTTSTDQTAILWDLTDPAQPRQLGPPLAGHTSETTSVAFAPGGRTLATGSADHTVILWDLTDPAQPHQLGPPLTGHRDEVNSVVFAPGGRTLATGSADHTVILWDVTDPAQPRQLGAPLTGHAGPVTAIALTPDGHTLITGSADYMVIFWDVTDLAQPRQLGSPLAFPTKTEVPLPSNSMALSPDGRTLVISTSADTRATIWDVSDPAQPRQLESPLGSVASPVDFMAFTPTGRTLVTGSSLGPTTLWELSDPARPYPLGPPLSGHNSSTKAVAVAPDGRTLATGNHDGTVIVWDVADPTQPQRLGPPLTGHRDIVFSVAFAPDGHTLATGGFDDTVILWGVADPVQPQRLAPPLTGHTNRIFSTVFNSDGHTLATASSDSTVILWNITDRSQPRPYGPPTTSHASALVSMAFAPDGRTLASGGFDGTLILQDVTDPAQPRQLGTPLTGHSEGVYSVSFAPDGRTLATGNRDGTVNLWDVTDRDQPRRIGSSLIGHTGLVQSVAFSPDGHLLATGSHDGTAILWDLTNPRQPRRLGPPLTRKFTDLRSVSGVYSVAFAPDGRTLALGGTDVHLWDLTDPRQPRRLDPLLPGNDPGVFSVTFAPDGHTLAAGGLDGATILWDLANLYQLRDHAVERACSITRGGLTRDEWADYVPDLPYQNTCPG